MRIVNPFLLTILHFLIVDVSANPAPKVYNPPDDAQKPIAPALIAFPQPDVDGVDLYSQKTGDRTKVLNKASELCASAYKLNFRAYPSQCYAYHITR